MQPDRECYGKLFPSVMQVRHNEIVTGKVFGYLVDFPGMAASRREVQVDRESWRQCLDCPDFSGCWLLSAGTLLMEQSLKR